MKERDDDVVTKASPHTLKKIELIVKYAEEWAYKILNMQASKGVIFIDCMSNSGVYKDEKGEQYEGTALRIAKLLDRIIQKYPTKKAICIFNDLAQNRIDRLKLEIEQSELRHVAVHYSNDDCNDFLRHMPHIENDLHTLLLYDPYNASIQWDAVAPFCQRWGDIIINHMVMDTRRAINVVSKPEEIARYEELYQQDIDTIKNATDKHSLDAIVQKIVARRARTQARTEVHIASFPFFNTRNGHVYNLILCTHHIEGLILYKKVAWQTFGNRSSLKETKGKEMQGLLNFDKPEHHIFESVSDCYNVNDIAQYVYDKYRHMGSVSLDEVFEDLGKHPIFPSEGYRNLIKKALKEISTKVSIQNKTVIFS